MEQQLTAETAEILDYIVIASLKTPGVYVDELKPIRNTPFGNMREVINSDYKSYIEILEGYKIVDITSLMANAFQITPKQSLTQQFINSGGFKRLYEKQKEEIEHQKEFKTLTLNKLRWDSKLSKWQKNTFWWVFLFGLVGGFSGIISLIMQLIKH